jgi:UDP-N-acetylmuramate--alanine ligase
MIADSPIASITMKPPAEREALFPGMRKFHFVGIGGIGMSALAKTLSHLGFEVLGSDRKESAGCGKLRARGIRVLSGHDHRLEPDTSALVYSTAISENNAEILEARRLGIPVLHRSEILAEFMNKRPSVSVTGTHGKTTTTGMISRLLASAGASPTCLVGGMLRDQDDNVILGSDELYVAEVDESDKSQLRCFPLYSVFTNMEREHLDHYRDFEDIKACFRTYGGQTRPEGFLVINSDDGGLAELFASSERRVVTYGTNRRADFRALEVRLGVERSSFRLYEHGRELAQVRLSVPGIHNVSNALAASALLIRMGYRPEEVIGYLADFRGTGRRLEVKLKTRRVMVVDDYAHHPTEIQASLRALKRYGRPLTVIFQPHRYSRTRTLLNDFGPSFHDADRLILTDIYSAGEQTGADISAEEVLKAVRHTGHQNAAFIRREALLEELNLADPKGEIFAFLGAGDIGEIANAFAIRFKR